MGVSEKKIEVPLSGKILKVFFLMFFILLLGLFAKTFQLQVFGKERFLAEAEANKFIVLKMRAERGVIYDKDLNQLVFNRPSFELICKIADLPTDKKAQESVLKEISQIIAKDLKDLKSDIAENQESEFTVSQSLSHEDLVLLETKITSKELPGFQIRQSSKREYSDQAFSHVLGYMGKITTEELDQDPVNYSVLDWVGRQGLENSYEETLRKNLGKLKIKRDALGQEISREIAELPKSGNSLVLYLDSGLQKKLISTLESILRNLGADNGSAVALDPQTGGVLALVSLPNFDNNLFSPGNDSAQVNNALEQLLNDPDKPLFNRGISGQYLMGSTIKPLIAAAALEEQILSPLKQLDCQGKIVIENPWYDPENPDIGQKEWIYHDWAIHDLTNVRKAIAQSCNVYFYTIGGGYKNQEGLGPSRIKKYLELFGWGKTTGIDLPAEAAGLIPSPGWKKQVKGENWWDGDTYHLSIGQGDILATPLQIASAFGAIANGGKLFQPQLVKEVLNTSAGSSEVLYGIEPALLRENFIEADNLEIVREGMREGVIYGSSVMLSDLPVKAASKTGTAQTPKEEYYHHWATVFAPYENPQMVLTIVIENVKGIQFAALPAAKEVLNWHFSQNQ